MGRNSRCTLDKYLGVVLFGAVATHPIIKGKVAVAAQKVTQQYDSLISNLKTILTNKGITEDVINNVRLLGGDAVANAIVRFSDSEELRTALLELSNSDLARFLNDFGSVSDELLVKLKATSQYVEY